MLANFLQQFYQLYKGQHKGLDLEMKKLLSTLSKTPNAANELSGNFSNIEKHQQEILTGLSHQHDQLNDAVNELRHLNYIPERVQQHVKESPQVLATSEPVSIASLLGEMNEVVKLYRYVVVELNQEFHLNHENDDKLIERYVKQLIKLADEFHINIALRDELDDIFNHLKETKTSHELYHKFQQLINLLVKNINNEKEASKYFLGTLNKALLDVKSIVTDSSSLTTDSSQKRKSWDEDLVAHLENIGSQLDLKNNKSLAQSSVAAEIDDILKAIKYKEMFDKKEFDALTKNFQGMEDRLKAVEEEAKGYKTKLDEQKILSMQDSLTKLPNRAALDETFSDQFKQAQEQNTPLWVIVADLDFFKKVNDNFGHSAGDKTLQVIASVISRSLRESEFVARFGGEEFVILVPNISKIALTKMLNRVREKVKSIPFKFKGTNVRVTISLGATKVKASDPGEYFTFERADQALYKAKEQGRDRVIIY